MAPVDRQKMNLFVSPIRNFHQTLKMNKLEVIKHSERVSGAKTPQKDNSKERPISPHVEIFKFPLPAYASISNRFSAVGMTLGKKNESLL